MRAFVVSVAGEDKPTAGNIQTFDTTSAIELERRAGESARASRRSVRALSPARRYER